MSKDKATASKGVLAGEFDQKRVNAAVKIKLRMDRRTTSLYSFDKLYPDLERLKAGMTGKELTEYEKRIA